MFKKIEEQFINLGITNHNFIILQTQQDLNFLNNDQFQDEYISIITLMLEQVHISLNKQSCYLYRPQEDYHITNSLFHSYLLSIDSDNWITSENMFKMINDSRIKRSDEHAIILYTNEIRCQDQLFTTYNKDNNTITIVIIELND
ncbi:hypothetical protein SS50377_23574 [Spironucleus salmonicida]|uniref:Uncharacterized protein n=1 Tax=Spironucleus salmonicida TaxID=348837 RepID=V6LV88_9EUKA|nr:hypothetical protein SS50377_23574 [Spironucleus salmonicida]|eukprot:EST48557.1 Hypothetical protein SS50377_11168 [Spironucleus salmonicida]